MIILGVDTSLRCTGYGVLAVEGRRASALRCGLIKTPARQPVSECLRRLDEGIRTLIADNQPDVCAIEGIFYCKNVRTAVTLGQARGVVIAACASAGVPVYEYPPRRVKQAVVGAGGAHKSQVAIMVGRLLNLPTLPTEDETDALAIALCHLQAAGPGSIDTGAAKPV
jgi:crossover junction endodeoxyribonuclease RuvC